MIARRNLCLLVALVLPLMVMRGMLPAGYMPVAEGGVLRMALCSDGLQLPGDTDQGNHQLPGGSGDCLFAHAAGVAPPAQGAVTATCVPALFHFDSAEFTSLPPNTGPPRISTARAPPAIQSHPAIAA